MIILKSKSPSCGIKTTPILNSKKEVTSYGNGIATRVFLEFFDEKIICSELSF